MSTVLGKLFRVCLNKVRPVAKGWASPQNTGWKKFINGAQYDKGDRILFQYGLKHQVLSLGYPKAMKDFHNVMTSAYSTTSQIRNVHSRIPNCLHQAAIELSELMANGAIRV